MRGYGEWMVADLVAVGVAAGGLTPPE